MGSGIRTCGKCIDFALDRRSRAGMGRCSLDGSLHHRSEVCRKKGDRKDPTQQSALEGLI